MSGTNLNQCRYCGRKTAKGFEMSEDEVARLCGERDTHIAEVEKLEKEGADPTVIRQARAKVAEALHALGKLRDGT